jgi:hypothetical protein
LYLHYLLLLLCMRQGCQCVTAEETLIGCFPVQHEGAALLQLWLCLKDLRATLLHLWWCLRLLLQALCLRHLLLLLLLLLLRM